MLPSIRKSLGIVSTLIAIVTVSHISLDVYAARRLDAAVARLERNRSPTAQANAIAERGLAAFQAACYALPASLDPDVYERVREYDPAADRDANGIPGLVRATSRVTELLDTALANPGWSPPRPRDGMDTALAALEISRFCEAAIRECLRSGDQDAAIAFGRRLCGIANALANEQTVLRQMVRLSIVNKSCESTRALALAGADLREAKDALPIRPLGALGRGWLDEAGMACDDTNSRGIDRWASDIESELFPRWRRTGLPLPFVSGWLELGCAEYVEFMIRNANQLDSTTQNIDGLKRAVAELKSRRWSAVSIFAKNLAPVLEEERGCCARVDLTRAGVEALRSFRESGKWPTPESFDPSVRAVISSDGSLEIASLLDPHETWRVETPRKS